MTDAVKISGDRYFKWPNLDNADTVESHEWAGGEGFIEVNGTPDGATVQGQFSIDDGATFYDLSTDEAPNGAKFTDAVGLVAFNLPKGHLKFTLEDGEASQDLTITVRA